MRNKRSPDLNNNFRKVEITNSSITFSLKKKKYLLTLIKFLKIYKIYSKKKEITKINEKYH